MVAKKEKIQYTAIENESLPCCAPTVCQVPSRQMRSAARSILLRPHRHLPSAVRRGGRHVPGSRRHSVVLLCGMYRSVSRHLLMSFVPVSPD